jgi:hypothetical protein
MCALVYARAFFCSKKDAGKESLRSSHELTKQQDEPGNGFFARLAPCIKSRGYTSCRVVCEPTLLAPVPAVHLPVAKVEAGSAS